MSVNAPSFKSQALLDDVAKDVRPDFLVNDATMDAIIDELAGYLVPTLKVQNLFFDSRGMVDFTFVPAMNVNIKNGLIDFNNINGGRIETRFITAESATLSNNFSVGNAAAGSSFAYNPETGIVGNGPTQFSGPLFLGDVDPGRILRAFPDAREPLIPEDAYLTSLIERQNVLPFTQFLEHSLETNTTQIVLRNGWPFVEGPQVGDWILIEYPGTTSKIVAQVTAPVGFGDTVIATDGNLMLNLEDPSIYVPPSNLAWISGPQLWGESGSTYEFGPTLFTAGAIGVGTFTPNVSIDISASDAVQLPKGTIEERPLAINSGYLRYNAETQRFEGTTQIDANTNVWTEFVTIRDLTRTGTVNVGSSNVPNTTFVILGDNAKVGIATSSPNVALDINSTDAIALPVGTMEERPLTFAPEDIGYFRYNSSNQRLEVTRLINGEIEWHHVLHEEDLLAATANIYANVHASLSLVQANLSIVQANLSAELVSTTANLTAQYTTALSALESNIFLYLANFSANVAASSDECCRRMEANLFEPPPAPTLVDVIPSTASVQVVIKPPDQVELAFLNTWVPLLREFQYDLIHPDGSVSSGTATRIADETRLVRNVYLMTGAVPAGTPGIIPSTDNRIRAYYRPDTESVYLHSIEPVTLYGLNLYYKNEVDARTSPKLMLTNLATLSAGTPTAPTILSATATMNVATVVVAPPLDHDSATEGNNKLPFLRNYRFLFEPLSTQRFGGLYSTSAVYFEGPEDPNKNDAHTTNALGLLYTGITYSVVAEVRNYLNPSYGDDSNALTFTTLLPPAPARLSTSLGSLPTTAAQALQYPLPGSTAPLQHRSLSGSILYTGHFLLSNTSVVAQPATFVSQFNTVQSTLVPGTTANVAAQVQVDVRSLLGLENANIAIGGFGLPSSQGTIATTSSQSVVLRITQDLDHYANQGAPTHEGFWKRVGAEARIQDTSTFPASALDYSVQLRVRQLADGSGVFDSARRIDFHVDWLTSTPRISYPLYWTPDVVAISGIPTVAPKFSGRFQFDVEQLASFFLRPDLVHASFQGLGLSATLTRTQMTGVAPLEYRAGSNSYAVSATSFGGVLPENYPRLQLHNLTYAVSLPAGTFTDNLTYTVTASNLLGTSAGTVVPYGDPLSEGVYLRADGTTPSRGRADEPAVVFDRATASPTSTLSISFSQFPIYVKGELDSRAMDPTIRANVGSQILTAGQRVRSGLSGLGRPMFEVLVATQSTTWRDQSCGGFYDHNETIVDEDVAELPFYNGKFRTARNAQVMGAPFLDYSDFFDQRAVRYDYTSLNQETDIRWTTFLFSTLRQEDGQLLPVTSKYAGVRIYLDGIEGDWQLDPEAQPADHQCWIRMYTDTTCTTPITAWLDATQPYVGSWIVERALTTAHPCLNPSYLNTAAVRHCYVNNLTSADAALLVRIGIFMNENKAFRSMRASAVNVF